MLLLHTSDWHLGRSLHRADLRDAQAAFLDHLVDTVRAERVDVVVVAGDVYDRAIPPVDAVTLCEDALVRLRNAGARVVVSSGNHDSARRLGFGSALVDSSGVHLRTAVCALADPVVIGDEHGPVALYAVPYLEPQAVQTELPPPPDGTQPTDGPLRGHAEVLGRATACIRADLARRGDPRSVVLAHAWVSGAAASESERDVSVGGVGCVPASTFDGFTYTALGHLHGQQTLREGLRYSGSPLPYSFSEAGHRKGSWLVEIGATGLGRVSQVPAPVHRRLSVLRGPLRTLLESPAYADVEDAFLSVVLTDRARPDEAMAHLRRRFPHVLVLTWEPVDAGSDDRSYGQRLRGQTDIEIAAGFVEHVRGTPPTPAEARLLRLALEAERISAQGDGGISLLPAAGWPETAADAGCGLPWGTEAVGAGTAPLDRSEVA